MRKLRRYRLDSLDGGGEVERGVCDQPSHVLYELPINALRGDMVGTTVDDAVPHRLCVGAYATGQGCACQMSAA